MRSLELKALKKYNSSCLGNVCFRASCRNSYPRFAEEGRRSLTTLKVRSSVGGEEENGYLRVSQVLLSSRCLSVIRNYGLNLLHTIFFCDATIIPWSLEKSLIRASNYEEKIGRYHND